MMANVSGLCVPFSQEIEEAILQLERPENANEWSSIIRQVGVAKFLQYTAATGKIDALRIALGDPTCKVDGQDEQGWTALGSACAIGKAESVKLLLQNGADVLISYPGGYTCLHMAAFWGHTDVVKVLMDENNYSESWEKCKALIYQKTSDEDFTALHMAATGSHHQGAPIAAAILEALRTSELNCRGLPLDPRAHYHIEDRLWLEFLLQVRNLLHLKGGEISLAVISGSLLAFGKRGVGRTLKKSLEEKFYEGLVQTYVDLVSYCNARDWIGRTALHHAAWENKADVVAFLMWDSREERLGCLFNVNIVDLRGYTALHCASKKGHKNVVEELLGKSSLELLVDAENNHKQKSRAKKMRMFREEREHLEGMEFPLSFHTDVELREKLEELEEKSKKEDLSDMGKNLLRENYL